MEKRGLEKEASPKDIRKGERRGTSKGIRKEVLAREERKGISGITIQQVKDIRVSVGDAIVLATKLVSARWE